MKGMGSLYVLEVFLRDKVSSQQQRTLRPSPWPRRPQPHDHFRSEPRAEEGEPGTGGFLFWGFLGMEVIAEQCEEEEM